VEKSFLIVIEFANKVQLQGLTHMLQKYIKKVPSLYTSHLKSCAIWDELKET
jgi:hypothetical protein